jgi:hypothetical protein
MPLPTPDDSLDAARYRALLPHLIVESGDINRDGTRHHYLGIDNAPMMSLRDEDSSPCPEQIVDHLRHVEQAEARKLAELEEASCEGGQEDGEGGSDE